MPPAPQQAPDGAPNAWVLIQKAPSNFDGKKVYEAASSRQFRDAAAAVGAAHTQPAAAATEARKISGVLILLRHSTAVAAGCNAGAADTSLATGATPAQESAGGQSR